MDNKDNSKIILVIITGLLVLGSIFSNEEGSIFHEWFVIASCTIGILHLLFPAIGSLMIKIWFKIGHILGWINTRILLTVIFYAILFPISILYKMSNRNSLQRKRAKGSIFIERNHLYTKKDLENIW